MDMVKTRLTALIIMPMAGGMSRSQLGWGPVSESGAVRW